MENTIIAKTISCIPDVIKNTHLNITLEGWPATVTVASGCITVVTIVAIKSSRQKAAPQSQEAA